MVMEFKGRSRTLDALERKGRCLKERGLDGHGHVAKTLSSLNFLKRGQAAPFFLKILNKGSSLSKVIKITFDGWRGDLLFCMNLFKT